MARLSSVDFGRGQVSLQSPSSDDGARISPLNSACILSSGSIWCHNLFRINCAVRSVAYCAERKVRTTASVGTLQVPRELLCRCANREHFFTQIWSSEATVQVFRFKNCVPLLFISKKAIQCLSQTSAVLYPLNFNFRGKRARRISLFICSQFSRQIALLFRYCCDWRDKESWLNKKRSNVKGT